MTAVVVRQVMGENDPSWFPKAYNCPWEEEEEKEFCYLGKR